MNDKIITGCVLTFGFIGSIHTNDGAEEIIEQYNTGMDGCVGIQLSNDEEYLTIDFEDGKQIDAYNWDQIIRHKIDYEKQIVTNDGKSYFFIKKLTVHHGNDKGVKYLGYRLCDFMLVKLNEEDVKEIV